MAHTPPDIERLDELFRRHRHVCLCVSGGADSLALLVLTRRWLDQQVPNQQVVAGTSKSATDLPEISVVTVDHGYRAGSADDADYVSHACATHNLPHTILCAPNQSVSPAQRAHPSEAEARELRYRLLLAHAKAEDCDALALAHHREDQIETFLMRLARGSGLMGLASMAERTEKRGIAILRPLLALSKSHLEAICAQASLAPRIDPTNTDPTFERARFRQAWASGLRDAMAGASGETSPEERLSETVRRLSRADEALQSITSQAWDAAVAVSPYGYAKLDRDAYRSCHHEVRLRLLARLVSTVRPGTRQSAFSPISRKLETFETIIARQPTTDHQTQRATFGGCLFECTPDRIIVTREPFRTAVDIAIEQDTEDPLRVTWDNRFEIHLHSPLADDETLVPLGEKRARTLQKLHTKLSHEPLAALQALPLRVDQHTAKADKQAAELKLEIEGDHIRIHNHSWLTATFSGYRQPRGKIEP